MSAEGAKDDSVILISQAKGQNVVIALLFAGLQSFHGLVLFWTDPFFLHFFE